jgi:hypothetical protein
VSDTLQSSGNPPISDRRIHWRQKVLLSCVQLGEDKGGIVLNISLDGLALQAVQELIDDELPQMRFQLSQSQTWVEAKGRIAWRSDSKKAAGVQFIGLSDEARKEIQKWISTLVPENRSKFPISILAGEGPSFPETRIVGKNSTDTETKHFRVAVAEDRSHITGEGLVLSLPKPKADREVRECERTSGSRKGLPLVGLFLAAAVFVLSVVLVGYHFGGTVHSPQGRQVTDRAKVPALSSGSSVNVESTANPTPPLDHTGFVLQVGVMAHEGNAVALAESLTQRSFPTFVLQYRANRFYRVFIGPYSDADSAMRVREELKRQGVKAIPTKWPLFVQ